MQRLSGADLGALMTCLERCSVATDLDGFAAQVLPAVRELIPSELIAYNEVDPSRGSARVATDPMDDRVPPATEALTRHLHEHPLVHYVSSSGDGSAHTISDFLSQRQFQQLGLYAEVFQPLDQEYEVAITLPAPPPLLIAITPMRSRRDFSERDRLLLNLLRPHLMVAYRNAEMYTGMKQALEASGRGAVVITRSGRVEMATSRAERWLAAYFPGSDLGPSGLPIAVESWLAWKHGSPGDDAVPQPARPLVVEGEVARLVVRRVRSVTGSVLDLLLFEEQLVEVSTEMLSPPALGRRETEVLACLCRGSSNSEIAELLGISVRTVEKHLERIYRKLGVQGRTQAAARALTLRTSASC